MAPNAPIVVLNQAQRREASKMGAALRMIPGRVGWLCHRLMVAFHNYYDIKIMVFTPLF